MRTPWSAVSGLFVLLVACGDGGTSTPRTDGGADAGPPRNDRLILGCTGAPVGDVSLEECARRLAMDFPGARLFVGPRAPCDGDIGSGACAPLCANNAMGNTRCGFEAPRTGCPFTFAEGYSVIVELDGRRAAAGVGGDSFNCPSTATGRLRHDRVAYADLSTAATCARSLPPGGLGPPRFGSCETRDAGCGPIMGDTCQALMFRTAMGPRTYNVCTRMCNADGDCGRGGRCYSNICFRRCGGDCALRCAEGFACGTPMGFDGEICLPRDMN